MTPFRIPSIASRRSLLPLMVLLLAFTASSAHAQSRQIPAPPQTEPILIHSATIHPVAGDVIEKGWILFRDGRIDRLAEGPMPPIRGARIINAEGLHIYPGLISSDTQLGLTETASVGVTVDTSEFGDMTPEVRAAVAVNPDSDLIPVTRSNGILTALTLPLSGTISGRGAIIRLDGWTWEDLAIEIEAPLVINWPRTEPITAAWMDRPLAQQRREIAESLKRIDDFFNDAEVYFRAKDNDPAVRTDLKFEALRDAISCKCGIFVRAASAGQIESAVAWAGRRGIPITILGGQEADRAIDILKRHDVPVIISGTHRLPGSRHDAYDRPFRLPGVLHEAGVRFAIASGAETAHERQLNHNAATAAAYGLPKEIALRAVTLSAAEILGIGDLLGSLEPGKLATMIITTGDPLEITTDVLAAFIEGRRIDMGDRQKMLYRKYQEKYHQLDMLSEIDEPVRPLD